MRKENLQEATQRALLEGYKNLNENKSKKVEAKEVKGMKDWKTDLMSDFKKGDLVSDDVVQEFRNSYPPITDTNKVVQGGEEYSYNQNGPTYITFTKVGNNWRFDGALNRIKEDKKVEGEEDTTSAPDYLEKAFEVEVEYWLKVLVDEDSNDEIGKRAQEVLDDKNKMKEIVNELVDGSDDLWEDIHRRIEELAGLHYRESSRVNESKKVEGAPNLNKEIGNFNRRLDVAEDYLRSKGFSEEELQELRDDTVLGKSALLDKYDEIMDKEESKKVTEAYNYNWRDDIDEVENTEENDELVYAFAENLIETDPDYADYDDPWEIISNIISIWKINKRSRLYDYLIKWYGSEEEMKKHIRSFYETNDAIYFETGCGYSIFDADLLGGNADGRTADEFGRFVANGGVKEESKKVESSRVNESNDVNNDINFEEIYKDVSEFSNEISIDDIKGAYNKLVDLKNQFNLSGKINVLGNFGFGIDVDKETAKRLYDEIDWYNKKYSVIIDETDFDKDIVCIAKECANAGQFGQIALDNVTNQAGYNDFARLEVTYNEI